MSDGNWEPLANFFITSNTRPTETIYCLTSRVSFRNTETHAVVVTEHASEEDIDRDYVGETLDLYKESYVEMQSMEKHDEEPVSCYCSASHTDNNYSTDEHDSVRDSVHRSAAHSLTQKVGLHQSDSGADLSEYHDQHEAKSIQNLLASYGKTFQASETDIAYDCKNVDIPTDYKHSSDNCMTEVSPCNPSSEKNKCCIDDSPSFTLDDRELLVQNLSDNTIVSNSTIVSNRETNGEDYTSLPQYNYPYSAYYETNKSAMDIAWEQFWAKNGEQIIWTSWIEKYADYINPDYLQNNLYMSENEKLQNAEINDVAIEKCYEQDTCFPNQAHKNCELVGSNFTGIFSKSNSNSSQFKPVFSSNTSFSFDQSSKQQSNDNDVEDSRKISTEIMQDGDNDGWNPLSPFSIEESYNQSSNAEDERLLTRCDSINGSIAKTNATSDSMTNVTKMTLTSSSCDSNSTHSSSLVSSFESSSIESNTTNSSSNQENELPMEDDKYWQQLWKEHFQLQYQQQYEVFIVNYKKEHRIDYDKMHESSEHVNENLIKDIESDHSDDRNIIQTDDIKVRRKFSRSHRYNPKRLIMNSVGVLMKNLSSFEDDQLKSDENESSKYQTEAQMSTVTEAINKTKTSQYNNGNSSSRYLSWRNSGESGRNKSWRNDELCKNEESCKNEGDGDKLENLVTTLKQSHEADNDENGKHMESVKKAFLFLGFAFNEYHDVEWKGNVGFFSRKRNSRTKCQNKQWKTNCNRLNTHIYFDDNGKASLNPIDKVNKYLSYHPSSLSAEVNGQFNDKGSYAQCTSSSDEETDTSPKKLQSKRFGFNKRSTSPVESWRTNVNQEMEQYASDVSYDDRLQHIEFDTLDNIEIDEQYDENNVKKTQKKKKKKQSRRNVNSGSMSSKVPPEIENDQTLLKYWYNRYHLFEKYDEGIQLDRESWYSVTPEVIAKHIAERCKSDIIIDAFCGAGGNAIQFAFTCERVIAIDIDPVKIELARNNARVYGVEDRIEFITGNFIELAPTLVADVIFMSPPWGGPEYKKEGKIFDLDSILSPLGGANLFKLAKNITNHVAYYLPKNIDTMQLITLTGDRHGLEIEQYLIGDRKLVALTVYYGELPKEV